MSDILGLVELRESELARIVSGSVIFGVVLVVVCREISSRSRKSKSPLPVVQHPVRPDGNQTPTGEDQVTIHVTSDRAKLQQLADHLAQIGHQLIEKCDLSADTILRTALEINTKLNRLDHLAANYCDLAQVYLFRKNPADAQVMYRQAIALNEKLGQSENLARNYASLGVCLTLQDDHCGAEAMMRKAIPLFETLNQLQPLAIQYHNLAQLVGRRGDISGAREFLHRAILIYETVRSPDGVADCNAILGNLAAASKEFDEARRLITFARDHFAKVGDHIKVERYQGRLNDLSVEEHCAYYHP